ncbi:MAG TPA: hybrid sensor histidine kinase/response regulator [Coleofasciculaceae cyanobacterium]
MARKKILVIEDEPTVRDNILELLIAEDFEVFGAGDGKSGVELAQIHRPDLIICDVMMPELDGFGVLSSLQSSPDTATIPFIFLTAKAENKDLRQGMSLGADDYLTKPFSITELLQAISTRMEKQAVITQQNEQKLERLRTSIALSLPIELRSPLQNILGFSQIIADESDSLDRQEIREMSQTIHRSAERLQRLIENFLLYAELELIATAPDTGVARLEALRSSRISSAASVIEEVAISISKRVNRETDLQLELVDASVQIAKGKLEKIVDELLDNAFKYSPTGTIVRVVGTPVEQGVPPNRFYVLSISDRGRGMTAAQIAEVGAYQQFERKLYEQKGSGLGLIVIKRLVELLGGELTIESLPAQQTTVKVTIPM